MEHPEQTTESANNSWPETQSVPIGSPSETGVEDMYLMLQGAAHIVPVTETNIDVFFLDDAGNRKDPIEFTLVPDPAGLIGLKVRDLQLIIQCNRAKFNALKAGGDLSRYVPKICDEIIETPENEAFMNPPPPPPFHK